MQHREKTSPQPKNLFNTLHETVRMSVTPDKKKSAWTGMILSLAGIALLVYGTHIFPTSGNPGPLFGSLLLIIFGVLLTTSSLLIFVVPATWEYLQEGLRERYSES